MQSERAYNIRNFLSLADQNYTSKALGLSFASKSKKALNQKIRKDSIKR